MQRVVVTPRMNLIAGPNNTGKSNIVRFLNDQYNHAIAALDLPGGAEVGSWHLDGDDVHQGSSSAEATFAIGIAADGPERDKLLEHENLLRTFGDRAEGIVDALFTLPELFHAGCIWFSFGTTESSRRLSPP